MSDTSARLASRSRSRTPPGHRVGLIMQIFADLLIPRPVSEQMINDLLMPRPEPTDMIYKRAWFVGRWWVRGIVYSIETALPWRSSWHTRWVYYDHDGLPLTHHLPTHLTQKVCSIN